MKLLTNSIDEILLNTHHLPQLFESHIKNKYPDLNIKLVYEPKLLGSVGTIRENLSWLSVDDFLVIHGDNFFEDDLTQIIDSKFDENKIFVSTFQTDKPQDCGVFEIDLSGNPIAYFEKNNETKFSTANAGIFKFPFNSAGLFNSGRNLIDISRDLLPTLLDQMHLIALKGRFIDIGTPQSLIEARELQAKYAK
jgi:mannose-1-phosphate guanylyltransferase